MSKYKHLTLGISIGAMLGRLARQWADAVMLGMTGMIMTAASILSFVWTTVEAITLPVWWPAIAVMLRMLPRETVMDIIAKFIRWKHSN